ncbi:MAG: hypothetical protein HXY41_00680 [Chloroflexi bacterium]|nr:hypothetical protein [Chloroflexota bacterium]
MREIVLVAWERLKIISAVVADANARGFATLFYFTILVPFGLASRFLSDPLRLRVNETNWLTREPVSNELDAARRQG